MAIYELAILGDASPQEREMLTKTISGMVAEFGLALGDDVVIRDGETITERDRHAAFAAAYFGGAAQTDQGAARDVVASSAPLIPVIRNGGDFIAHVPPFLHSANGLTCRNDDPEMSELAIALLECVGLLRRQRRVFVSYRRTESREAALQMHDLLSSRGFDVFLDTHGIRPSDPFQEVLWHRLCDSDVMVMLDTPTYFESRWTREEIGRARAKEIHVLRVIWPGHQPNKLADLADTVYLEPADLVGEGGPIVAETADAIAIKVERLRSRSIASRYMSITGRLRADVEKIGASVEGIGAHRAVAVRLLDERRIWIYPVVGVPTAETMNDVAEKARRADQREVPVLLYDHIGIREAWSEHLKWLHDNIRAVRSLKVSEAGWTLAGWEP